MSQVGAQPGQLSTVDALAAGLARLLGGPVPSVQRLSGGASQETWAFDAVLDGTAQPLILRRAPPGAELRGSGNAGLAAEAVLIRRAGAVGVQHPRGPAGDGLRYA